MLFNLQELKQGSLLFIRYRCDFLSWFISWLIGFRYSNLGVYLGDNKILEAKWFGFRARQVPLQKYLNNDMVEGEVITLFQEPEDMKLFIDRVKKLTRKQRFVYAIQKALFGLEIDIPKKKITIRDIYKKIIKITR